MSTWTDCGISSIGVGVRVVVAAVGAETRSAWPVTTTTSRAQLSCASWASAGCVNAQHRATPLTVLVTDLIEVKSGWDKNLSDMMKCNL